MSTLASTSYRLSTAANTAAAGLQDQDDSSPVLESAVNTVVSTSASKLNNDPAGFHALSATRLMAGDYRLIIKGINSPTQRRTQAFRRSRRGGFVAHRRKAYDRRLAHRPWRPSPRDMHRWDGPTRSGLFFVVCQRHGLAATRNRLVTYPQRQA